MSYTIIPVKRYGMRDRFAYTSDGKGGLDLALNNSQWNADYACGYLPPHYPMPAPMVKFEYERNGRGQVDGLCMYERTPRGLTWLIEYWPNWDLEYLR